MGVACSAADGRACRRPRIPWRACAASRRRSRPAHSLETGHRDGRVLDVPEHRAAQQRQYSLPPALGTADVLGTRALTSSRPRRGRSRPIHPPVA